MRHLVHIAFVFLSFISQAQSSLLLKIYGLKNTNATFYLGDSIYLINAQNTSIYGFQPGDYHYRLQLEKQEIKDKIYLKKGINSLIIEVPELWVQLNRVNVLGNRAKTSLTNVIGTEIFAAKKTELIAPDSRTMNLANNNARQLFNRIPGLNIWENDASGLQINIGTRGLNPNRTSNLNTRQNGYDISADALGYPESYYVPPAEAIEQIRFVRGAAALQSGPHFGGLLDYQLKEKEESQLVVRQSLTGGSFKFVNSFTSIGGTKNKWSYYGFFQRKQGEGFLPNAKFHQNTGYVSLGYQISEKSKIKFQYTRMKYLAQQPGGLTDTEFEMNPYQAKRLRNWFDVDWNLYALFWNKRFSNQRRLKCSVFHFGCEQKISRRSQ
jgi:Fe(3+) dicitrate transport protein